jgi:hypothetical protein
MSKDTPEIGDVWIDEFNHRMYISYSDDSTTCVNVFYKTKPYIGLDKITVITKEFIKAFTYLGKSKANIDDLFKTENE